QAPSEKLEEIQPPASLNQIGLVAVGEIQRSVFVGTQDSPVGDRRRGRGRHGNTLACRNRREVLPFSNLFLGDDSIFIPIKEFAAKVLVAHRCFEFLSKLLESHMGMYLRNDIGSGKGSRGVERRAQENVLFDYAKGGSEQAEPG